MSIEASVVLIHQEMEWLIDTQMILLNIRLYVCILNVDLQDISYDNHDTR